MDDYMTPRLAAWRRRTDAPLLILAIGSLPMLLLDLKRHDLAYHDRVFLDIVNIWCSSRSPSTMGLSWPWPGTDASTCVGSGRAR